jgi:hypothetical protein
MEEQTIGFFGAVVVDSTAGLSRPSTRLTRICLLGFCIQFAASASATAQSTQPAGNQQQLLMDRQKEIALALIACPPSVASKGACTSSTSPATSSSGTARTASRPSSSTR